MSITVKVNGDNNSVAHKGCSGFAKSTLPDVCKTPSPGGPVPVPYPIIISMASDLANGTATVTADGGNSIAIKGSEFSRCSGDEPGTAGGVKSSTNMKEATWILYSFTVKMEGKNACRLGDKLFMNHENTACLGGWTELPVLPKNLEPDALVACAIWCCDQVKYRQSKGKTRKKDCQRLGSKKHSCVHHTLKGYDNKDVQSAPRFGDKPPLTATPSLLKEAARMRGKKTASFLTPDVLITAPGEDPRIIDAKFPCPGKGATNKRLRRDDGRIVMNGSQSLPSGGGAGVTPKELKLYPKLKVDGKEIGSNNVETMTPQQAKATAEKNNCDCKQRAKGTKESPPASVTQG
jgi:hypothetical protein